MSSSDFDDRSRASFRLWGGERIRFNDLDAYGHANNNAIGVLVEQGRVFLLERLGLLHEGAQRFILARIEIDFLAEMNMGDVIDIGVRVAGLGRTSMRISVSLFKGEVCCARSLAVGVLVDWTTRKPVPLGDDLRAQLLSIAG